MDTIIQTLINESVGRDVLYVDDFKNNVKTLTVFNEIRKLVKEKKLSKSAVDYLTEKGFFRNVEADMRTLDIPSRESCSSLSEYIKKVFTSYPLFGFAIFTDTDSRELYEAGNSAFQVIARQERSLSDSEQDMLIMSTIQLLKSWQPKNDEDSAFWSHVYRQYGYRDDHDEALTNKIYTEFRRAVRDVLQRNNRYIASSDTHRYYTTLMLHALSPMQSMINLFEILIRFFEKNLLLEYVENDTSYRTFVDNMRARWDAPDELERIGLYSAQLASGLKTLFLHRPYYMAELCEQIVKQIDKLLSQGYLDDKNVSKQSTATIYLDTLLVEWYQKKSSIQIDEWKSQHSSHSVSRVVTQAKYTHPLYVLSGNKAALFIPSIRLDKTSGDFPTIHLFQDDNLVYRDELDVYGNELCWTTQKRQIVLEDTALSFIDKFNIRMEIEFNGEIIFNSKERLYRSLILFNQAGNEISPNVCKRGTIFLLAGEMTRIESKNLEEGFALSHEGRLLELLAENVQDLRVNDIELFISEDAKSGFRIYPSKMMVSDSWVIHQGERIPIFQEQFILNIHLPVVTNRLPYVVYIDQSSKPLCQYCEESEIKFSVDIPNEPWIVHVVCIKDIINSSVLITFKYIVIPGFSIQYDKKLFIASNPPVTGTYRVNDSDVFFSAPLNDDYSISLVMLYQNIDLLLQPPVFSCALADTNIFENEMILWHKDISQSMFLTPDVPEGWNCSLNIDNHQIPPIPGTCKYDIGNYLHSFESRNGKEYIWFSMRNAQGDKENIVAFCVIFKPMFVKDPLIVEDGALHWRYEENYYGPKSASFQVNLSHNGALFATYTQIEKDEVIEKSFPFDHGYFTYTVSLEGKSIFGSSIEEIYQGKFTLGSPDMLRFTNHNIDLTFAVCWNDKERKSMDIPLFEKAARISHITHIGNSIPSGEDSLYPEYQGCLSFFNNKSKTWQSFNSIESYGNFELINPVKFWVINDNILILHSCTDDGLYFDKFKNQIINRDPYSYMIHSEILEYVDVPDYFRYDKKELPNAQSY